MDAIRIRWQLEALAKRMWQLRYEDFCQRLSLAQDADEAKREWLKFQELAVTLAAIGHSKLARLLADQEDVSIPDEPDDETVRAMTWGITDAA